MKNAFIAFGLLLLLVSTTHAQIVNGGFESAASWNLGGEATIGAAGGVTGGYAFVGVGLGTSLGTVTQTFNCPGDAGSLCEIRFMYRILHPPSGSANLSVKVDAVELTVITSPVGGWTAGLVTTSCGLHTLTFDVAVTSGTVCLDDVSSQCVPGIPTDVRTWGAIKSLYQLPH